MRGDCRDDSAAAVGLCAWLLLFGRGLVVGGGSANEVHIEGDRRSSWEIEFECAFGTWSELPPRRRWCSNVPGLRKGEEVRAGKERPLGAGLGSRVVMLSLDVKMDCVITAHWQC